MISLKDICVGDNGACVLVSPAPNNRKSKSPKKKTGTDPRAKDLRAQERLYSGAAVQWPGRPWAALLAAQDTRYLNPTNGLLTRTYDKEIRPYNTLLPVLRSQTGKHQPGTQCLNTRPTLVYLHSWSTLVLSGRLAQRWGSRRIGYNYTYYMAHEAPRYGCLVNTASLF